MPNARRNRAALREFYGLKQTQQDSGTASPVPDIEIEKESELDQEGFDAERYVKDLLANESLEGILRAEASLISETRSLDGEKKALVYDNYSKLIAATETIRKMRTNMDPLSPTTSTLTPAISHIAERATTLSDLLKRQNGSVEVTTRSAQQHTVRWVLDAPQRFGRMLASGEQTAVEAQWNDVKRLLDRWEGVEGVEEVRKECLAVLSKGKA